MDLLAPLKKITGFSYDAVSNKGRRRPPHGRLRNEDVELSPSDRRKLVATTRDLQRNFAIAAWAIRKHLDYVSSFTFQSRTADPALNQRIEELMAWWALPWNCDVASRHPLRRLIRLLEARKTVDGDAFLLKLSSGMIQAIEGDRVRTPTSNLPAGFDASTWAHGVKVTPSGRAMAFAICDRLQTGSGFVYRTTIPARHILHHASFDRFDQVRGVSPIAAALNSFQDVYESVDYALMRAKVSQLFALAFYRDSDTSLGELAGEGEGQTEPYKIDFGKGPQVLDLEPGDKAEFLESQQPSSEFQNFMQVMISVCLKSLDIPYSFYSEDFTNFYGSRGAVMQYLKSCESKREDLKLILDQLTRWRLGLFVQDGELELPNGMTTEQLKWDWVPAGVPWWDPAKEIRGDQMAVAAGFDTRTDIIRRRTGRDFRDVIDKLAEEQAYIQSRGVLITGADPSIYAPDPVVAPAAEGDSSDD